MAVHLNIDPDSCIGSGECVALDPDAMELDEQGTAHVRISELEERRAKDICDACPVGALSIAVPATR